MLLHFSEYQLRSLTNLQHINRRMTSSSTNNHSNIAEELRIPVPWGFVAAKWWGPKNNRPILGLHGWQDNAGTFDRLIPLLPKNISLLALDLPGHGLSSPIPAGLSYDKSNFIYTIKYLKKQYNWDKISIMGHSMGAILGFVYCSLYPDEVDMMIAIDALKPFYIPPHHAQSSMLSSINGVVLETERNMIKSEPPCYSYPELVDKLCAGMNHSVEKENAIYILKRGVKKSQLYPEKYYFIRDGRIKHFGMITFDPELCDEMIKRITSPYCLILFTGSSALNPEDQVRSAGFVHKMYETLPHMEIHKIDGRHHDHLNRPEKVANIITSFVDKNRPDFDKSRDVENLAHKQKLNQGEKKKVKNMSKL